MTLKEFRELTKDYAEDVIITIQYLDLDQKIGAKVIQAEHIRTDIENYIASDGKIKTGKLIVWQ